MQDSDHMADFALFNKPKLFMMLFIISVLKKQQPTAKVGPR